MASEALPQPDSHDLRLPAWGPYNKKYDGLAHIPELNQGLRFELSVFPGYFRHGLVVPSAKWEGNHHAWEAAPGLTYFSYRYELEWKDNVYCDVAFFALPGEPEADARLVRCELVNNTDLAQHLVLHYVASLSFPPVRPYSDEALRPAAVQLPPSTIWVDALDYAELRYAAGRPSDNLVYEGWLRGEVRDHGFVHGTGLGGGFGQDAGDRVGYRITAAQALEAGLLLVRYRARQGPATFRLHGLVNAQVTFAQTAGFELLAIPLGPVAAGGHPLELVAGGGQPLELDGFALVEARSRDRVQFSERQWRPVPQLASGPRPGTLLLRYADVAGAYGLAWGGEPFEVRECFSSELERTLSYFVNDHVAQTLPGDGRGHFADVFIRPIVLEPHSRSVRYGLACHGKEADVQARLAAFGAQAPVLEEANQQARQSRATVDLNPSGQAYAFSQERLAATLLTNVVYPVYTRRRYIRHFTPGKWWDCLYTWDSGFISLGLLDIDLARAVDCLNAYTTPPGDEQAAFLHHGSPVPTQIYAFQELWNRTRSAALLRYFYPRLRQMWLFLAGRLGSTTTRRLRSGLLKTWDYFYNSGGWDDYPAQVYVHAHGLEATVTPVVTTSHVIRCARILQQAAGALGLAEDVAEYQAEIEAWTQALNAYAWDDEAGVFSYVTHRSDGEPMGILRGPGGQNLNLGFDGLSPLFAGICSPEQERRLRERLESPEHLWTRVGLTAVDQSADYYKADGYWNGTVWFPYQWLFWKAMLDLGYGDLAYQIARTALDTWRAEVAATYNCFEHFVVASGRGAGWHQFGGLSAPILAWCRAYHQPGSLTCGFDTWVEALDVSGDARSLRASLRHAADGRRWLALAVMRPDCDYRVDWNGQPAEHWRRAAGTLEVTLAGAGELTISAA